MLRFFTVAVAATTIFLSSQALAGPGSFSLRAKGGPSFNLQDWHTQGRIGGEFDYDFGYSIGFNLMGLIGVSNKFRFDLIPSFRYDYLFLGPATMFALGGIGYTVLEKRSALGMRFATGITMPLGSHFEFNTDANFFITPAGTPGTPVVFDWLMAFGFHYD